MSCGQPLQHLAEPAADAAIVAIPARLNAQAAEESWLRAKFCGYAPAEPGGEALLHVTPVGIGQRRRAFDQEAVIGNIDFETPEKFPDNDFQSLRALFLEKADHASQPFGIGPPVYQTKLEQTPRGFALVAGVFHASCRTDSSTSRR